MYGQELGGAAREFTLLSPIDGGGRAAPATVAARTDLDEKQLLAVQGDEVEFAKAAAVAPRDDAAPGALQQSGAARLESFAVQSQVRSRRAR